MKNLIVLLVMLVPFSLFAQVTPNVDNVKIDDQTIEWMTKIASDSDLRGQMMIMMIDKTKGNKVEMTKLVNSLMDNPETLKTMQAGQPDRNSNNNILTNYTNRVKFDVYYRTSTSSSWNKTSSSYYYTINPSYTNWYKFISSDYGQKNLYDFIRFNKNNLDYKVRVYDENNSNIYNDIYFYVNTAETNSNIAWFTVKEVEMIQRIYNIRPQLIRQLKAEHPRFNTNTIWKNLWNDLYSNMKDVLDNKTWRKFTNYSKFFSDFMVWYNRTMDVIH